MPQKPLMPANTSPAPTRMERKAKLMFTVSARIPPVAAMVPAMMRTWRSRLKEGRPRMTEFPVAVHSWMPPSRTWRLVRPDFERILEAL